MGGAVSGPMSDICPLANRLAEPRRPDPDPAPIALPPLRDDLALLEGPRAFDGAPTWTVHDPVRNRYFRIGYAAFQLLSRWPLGDGRRLLAEVAADTTVAADEADLDRLLRFLDHNDLLAETSPEAARRLADKRARGRQNRALWLLKNYLFLRIPLVRPDGFLTALAGVARPLFSRGFGLASLAAALLGLTLAARQWDAFVHTFLRFLSWEGAVYYALALLAAKVLHELGHAFAAKLNGCRVPTMGVAFLVLWPVLYTDVTDAWRLKSRRERLRIGAAGMGAELMLAAWATLAWSFLPDGPLRSACFLVATVTWLLTLAINLNPFLRFDGYYLLSDWLGVQNLQARGFALGRWHLRETLFGVGLPKPERLGPRLEGRLILYAYATWIWRFFLFVAIALIVYHAFFKLLGIFLMVVELLWFIGRPLADEVRAWWSLRGRLRPNRNLLVALVCLGGLVALVALPWQRHVHAPALIEARQSVALYPPGPARLEAVFVVEGEAVDAGTPLYRLANPQLAQSLRTAELRVAALQHEILRRAVSRRASGEIGVLEEQLAESLADLRGLRAQAARLEVVAPSAGVLTDVPAHLVPGRWLAEGEALGRLVDRSAARLHAYVTAEALARLAVGAAARVYPDDIGRQAMAARVTAIDTVDIAVLDNPWLVSLYGGPIAVQPGRGGAPIPVEPIYRVALAAEDPGAAPDQILRGTARIEAAQESLAARLWRTAASVVIRESGF